MEQNQAIVTNKFYKIVRVMYFMMRRGISKGKLLAELNMSMKRAKIAGKLADIHNIMFHHHQASSDYDISHLNKLKRYQAPPLTNDVLMAAAVEIIDSTAASPALPGFGPSPNVRQLRITDSPFPLRDNVEEDSHVDEAAEEFIMKFYRGLRHENAIAY